MFSEKIPHDRLEYAFLVPVRIVRFNILKLMKIH